MSRRTIKKPMVSLELEAHRSSVNSRDSLYDRVIQGSEADEYVMPSADSSDGSSGATDNGTGFTLMAMEAVHFSKADVLIPDPSARSLVGHAGGQ
jgi:hypothetical protein